MLIFSFFFFLQTFLLWAATEKSVTFFLCSVLQIAGHRLADQIPMVIRYQMLQESAMQLQREMLQMLQDKEKIEYLLQEDPGTQSMRNHLQNRLDRLTKARILLTDFSLNIFSFSAPQVKAKEDVEQSFHF